MKQQTQIVKRQCPYRTCKVMVEFVPRDLGSMFHQVKLCDFHKLVNKRSYVLFEMALPRYRKKELVHPKSGRRYTLVYGTDLSNYLFEHNRKEFNKIEKRAIQWVKKHG